LFHYRAEIAANSRVGGLIRTACGSGESDQSCKSPIRPDSSLFRRDSVPRAGCVRSRPGASRFARSKVLSGQEAKRPGPLIRKEPLLRVPFDRNTGLSLQTLGGEAYALPPCTDGFHDCWSEQRERHQMAHIAVACTPAEDPKPDSFSAALRE